MSSSQRTKNVVTEKCRTTYLSRFPTNILPQQWNELSLENKNIASKKVFKKNIIFDKINAYKSHITCANNTCPDCLG